MGRHPKLAAPHARAIPSHPTPPPADYSDEVSEEQLKALKALVKDTEDEDEWELVDGPGW